MEEEKAVNTIKRLIQVAIESGLPLPHAYDPVAKAPSFRLLAAYISLILAVVSIIALHLRPELLPATWTTIGFFGLCMVFYMLKKLQQAKIDLDDREISLSADSDAEKS